MSRHQLSHDLLAGAVGHLPQLMFSLLLAACIRCRSQPPRQTTTPLRKPTHNRDRGGKSCPTAQKNRPPHTPDTTGSGPQWVCLRCNALLDRGHDMLRDVPAPPVCRRHGPCTFAIDFRAGSRRGWIWHPQLASASYLFFLPSAFPGHSVCFRQGPPSTSLPQLVFGSSPCRPPRPQRRSRKCGRRFSSGRSGKWRPERRLTAARRTIPQSKAHLLQCFSHESRCLAVPLRTCSQCLRAPPHAA